MFHFKSGYCRGAIAVLLVAAVALTGHAFAESSKSKDSYYRENAKVVKTINASQSADVLTEEQVIEMLKERGFSADKVTYEFRMGGEYVGEKSIKGDPNKKRPMYMTDYFSAAGELWTIFVINGDVIANPVSYNIQSTRPVQFLVSEKKEITSYDHTTDTYYVTIPGSSVAVVKKIKKINAAALDKLTCEGLTAYE
ncbi:MAG: hypothetical protein J6X08_03065 [Lachnospiraceae bacterium]|nr:hypothetical protein [Lachnospiraceae bacterium]